MEELVINQVPERRHYFESIFILEVQTEPINEINQDEMEKREVEEAKGQEISSRDSEARRGLCSETHNSLGENGNSPQTNFKTSYHWKKYNKVVFYNPTIRSQKVIIYSEDKARASDEYQFEIDYSSSFHTNDYEKQMKDSGIKKIEQELEKPKEVFVLKKADLKKDLQQATLRLASADYKKSIEMLLFDLYSVFRFSEKAIEKQVLLTFQNVFFKSIKGCIRNLLKYCAKYSADLNLNLEEIDGLNTKELLKKKEIIKLKDITPRNMLLKSTVYNSFINEGIFPINCDIIKNDESFWDWPNKLFTNKLITPWTEKFHTSFMIGDLIYDFYKNDMITQKLAKDKIIHIPRPCYRIPILDFFPLDIWIDKMAQEVLIIMKKLQDVGEGENNWKNQDMFTSGYIEADDDSQLLISRLEKAFQTLAKSFLANYGSILLNGDLLQNICWSIVKTEVTPYKICSNNCQTPVSKIIYYLNETLSPYRSPIVTEFSVPDFDSISRDSDRSLTSEDLEESEVSIDSTFGKGKVNFYESPQSIEFRRKWKVGVMRIDTLLNYFGIWADKYQSYFLKKLDSLMSGKKVKDKKRTAPKKQNKKQSKPMIKEPDFELLEKIENFFLDTTEESDFEKYAKNINLSSSLPPINDKISYLFFKLRNKYLNIRMKLKRNKEQFRNYLIDLSKILVTSSEAQPTQFKKNTKASNLIELIIANREKYVSNINKKAPLDLKEIDSYIEEIDQRNRLLRKKKRSILSKLHIFGLIYYNSVRMRNSLKISPGGMSHVGYVLIRDPQIDYKLVQF